MTALLARLRAFVGAAAESGRAAGERLVQQRRRRADARGKAICPVDSWTFTPLYTKGKCPLCGWQPEGYVYAPPFLAPYERYWGALGGILATSVLMCIVVVVAYTQG
jgi:hypothetical protein